MLEADQSSRASPGCLQGHRWARELICCSGVLPSRGDLQCSGVQEGRRRLVSLSKLSRQLFLRAVAYSRMAETTNSSLARGTSTPASLPQQRLWGYRSTKRSDLPYLRSHECDGLTATLKPTNDCCCSSKREPPAMQSSECLIQSLSFRYC